MGHSGRAYRLWAAPRIRGIYSKKQAWILCAEYAVYIPLTYETNKALYTSELKGVHFGTDQYDVDFASMYFE